MGNEKTRQCFECIYISSREILDVITNVLLRDQIPLEGLHIGF